VLPCQWKDAICWVPVDCMRVNLCCYENQRFSTVLTKARHGPYSGPVQSIPVQSTPYIMFLEVSFQYYSPTYALVSHLVTSLEFSLPQFCMHFLYPTYPCHFFPINLIALTIYCTRWSIYSPRDVGDELNEGETPNFMSV